MVAELKYWTTFELKTLLTNNDVLTRSSESKGSLIKKIIEKDIAFESTIKIIKYGDNEIAYKPATKMVNLTDLYKITKGLLGKWYRNIAVKIFTNERSAKIGYEAFVMGTANKSSSWGYIGVAMNYLQWSKCQDLKEYLKQELQEKYSIEEHEFVEEAATISIEIKEEDAYINLSTLASKYGYKKITNFLDNQQIQQKIVVLNRKDEYKEKGCLVRNEGHSSYVYGCYEVALLLAEYLNDYENIKDVIDIQMKARTNKIKKYDINDPRLTQNVKAERQCMKMQKELDFLKDDVRKYREKLETKDLRIERLEEELVEAKEEIRNLKAGVSKDLLEEPVMENYIIINEEKKDDKLVLFENMEVMCRKDGKVHMKKFEELTGKKVKNWTQNKQSQEALIEYSELAGIPASSILLIEGRDSVLKNELRGTYMPWDLVVQFLWWASPKYALRFGKQLNELYLTGDVSLESSKMFEELNVKSKALLDITKKYKMLTNTHDTLAIKFEKTKKKQHYPKISNDRKAFYVICLDERIENEYKVGVTDNVDARLSQYRTPCPKATIMYLIYLEQTEELEDGVLFMLDKFRKQTNKEIVCCDFQKIMRNVKLVVENNDYRCEKEQWSKVELYNEYARC